MHVFSSDDWWMYFVMSSMSVMFEYLDVKMLIELAF